MKSKKNVRHNLFVSWLFSYLFILLIPLLTSIIIYSNAVDIIEKEVDRVHTGSLAQLKQVIDGKLNEIENISIEIALDKGIESLVLERDTFSNFQRYIMVNVMNKLSTYNTVNNIVDNVNIFFKNNKYILSSDGSSYDMEDWYQAYFNDISMDYEQYERLLMSNYSKKFKILFNKNDVDNEIKILVFLQSIPIYKSESDNSTIMITIKQDELKNAIHNIEWISQGTVVILDSNNNIVVSTKEVSFPDMIHYNSLNETTNKLHTKLLDEEVVVSFIESEVTDWKYISIIPSDIFLEKLKHIRTITIISIIICLILGGLVSFIFTKRNYNPLKRIVNLFSGIIGKPDGRTNEYGFIEDSIHEVIEEREKHISSLDKQKVFLKNIFFIRLIKGRINKSSEIIEAINRYNIEFPSNKFAVILFYIEKIGVGFQEKHSEESEDSLELVHFIIKNIVEELVSRNNYGYVTEVNNMPTCLISFRNENLENIKADIYRIAEESKMLIENKFKIFTSVSISNVHDSINEIHTAYQEAVEGMENMKLMAHNFIIDYKSINAKNGQDGYGKYSFENEKKLENAILTGNFADAEKILSLIFEEDIAIEGTYSIQMLKCRMFGLINIIFAVTHNLSVTYGEEFLNTLRPVERVLECNTLPDLKKEMTEILKSLDKYVKNKNRDSNIIDRITSYINTNYSNRDITVSTIADAFNLNASYLSRSFKEHSKMGLLKYIHMVRINHSKRLLEDTDMRIKHIAVEIGFENSINFIRAFKKYEGISPGKYREMKTKK